MKTAFESGKYMVESIAMGKNPDRKLRNGHTVEEAERMRARGMKWCGGCKAWHPFEAFGKNRAHSLGLDPWCLESRRVLDKGRYQPKPRTTTVWTVEAGDPEFPEWALLLPRRFRLRLSKSSTEALCGGFCWECSGAHTESGYAEVHFEREHWLGHRLVWTLVNGPIPDGDSVLHHCDNPPCCFPGHLFSGTAKDNAADMLSKGRQAAGDRSALRKYPELVRRGEESHWTRLTEKQVTEIIRRRLIGERQCDLAEEFGVHHNHVGRLVRGERWAHLARG